MTRPRSPFRIIYADPPWGFGDKQANRPDTYLRMRPREIRALDVHMITADDCSLFLWSTWTHLPIALSVIKSWGFEFKGAAFLWHKTNADGSDKMGMGSYLRQSTEPCLLGVKGHPKRLSASVRQFVETVPGRHSAKPPEVRERIVELLGDVPRIELFARERVIGWDAWGLDV